VWENIYSRYVPLYYRAKLMFELITALLTTEEAFSTAERRANSSSFLSLAPVEPSLKRSGSGSDAAGSFGGLASKPFISSPIHTLGENTLCDNSATLFGVTVNSTDTVQVQGKNPNGHSVSILTIRILGDSGKYPFRAGHTFVGVARP
jgi:hypothetical protein